MKFTEFGFDERLVEGIYYTGFEDATPVQEQVIPHIMEGKDIIASAQTGTGKTAAFLLPLIHKIISMPEHEHINALIIVPTRELAIQISQNLEGLSYFTPISNIAVYGGGSGASFVQEKQALSKGADIVISTPGRLIGHLAMGYVKLQKLDFLVLDEADRMMDMGFNDDIMKIISFLPATRQTLLFSATMPSRIRELSRKILKNPVEINIAVSAPPKSIHQQAYVVYEKQKLPLIKHILSTTSYSSVLIFCSKKHNVKDLTRLLKSAKLSVDEIHSDLEQDRREEVLAAFANRRLRILVATDILSRGIDIDNIELVINYEVPNDGEDYVHRIGRTARAQTDGVAITFVNELEQRKFQRIEELVGEVEKPPVPADFGEAPAYEPVAYRKNKRPNQQFRNPRQGGNNQGGGNRQGGGSGQGGNNRQAGNNRQGGNNRQNSNNRQSENNSQRRNNPGEATQPTS
ncbi:DEAD/DEAH box helicase [Aridibaculum aurantiacum]|uniref:DEAD/DEAH box helicase n=1 Tax=Aridibaculum aurantiacum TaxID=2810307 RepID=UPI001A9791B4|nr:DEAD/DEAH box helicase [Aridibaculum aurantiacum]